jgi:hypothetical protein
MTQDQAGGDRVTDRADPDLQRPAIRHQARHLQPDRMLGQADRLLGRGEQGMLDRRPGQDMAELTSRHRRRPGHERQRAVDLADQAEVRCPLGARRQQVDREIRVAAQAVPFLRLVRHHELCDQVDAHVEHDPNHMAVVGRDVALLGTRHLQPAAGQEEELVDLDVRRQRVLAQHAGIGKLGIVAEQPLDHWFDEAPLQQAARLRLLQGQGGDDAQRDRGIRHGAAPPTGSRRCWSPAPRPA